MSRRRRVLLGLGVVLAALWLVNTNLILLPPAGHPLLIAHRGVAQPFSREGLTGETCTAAQMMPSGHEYMENTLPSIAEAFRLGADYVEFDVQPTTDRRFVVFHDWTLDCRTNGSGRTRDHSLAELRGLDLGYGYTADGGETWPFRGRFIGLMPTLEGVLEAFPEEKFLVNIKSDDPFEGALLAETLKGRRDHDRLIIYGDRAPTAVLGDKLPGIRILRTDRVKSCLIRYALLGWSSYVPAACRGSLFMAPVNYAPYLWGFPGRLHGRLQAKDTLPVLLGPYDHSGYSSGIDSAEELALVPDSWRGAIWTNRIDRIGPLAASRWAPGEPP